MRMRSTIVGAAVVAAAVVTPGAAAAAASSAATFADGSATSAVVDHVSSYFESWRKTASARSAWPTAESPWFASRWTSPSRESVGAISGLAGDTNLVGIDYRVQNGKLYGVGNAGGLYVISADNAKASKVGQLSVALSGTSFGVDFNPAANALRSSATPGRTCAAVRRRRRADGPRSPTRH